MNDVPLKDESPRTDLRQLIARLCAFQDWLRGGDGDQPDPAAIGGDIDEAIEWLEAIDLADRILIRIEEDHS